MSSDARSPGRVVLVMAAGTGGHVYPALAVSRRLRDRGFEVHWLGTATGIEARLVPEAGFPLHRVRVGGLRGKGLARWLLAPALVGRALLESLALVRRLRPAVVLGMGGYVAGPGGLAAWLLRRPLAVHEQNALPGLTNRLLAPIAVRVMEAFPGSFPRSRRAVLTGNPVRADIAGLAPPERRLAGRTGPLRLLVLGGSQGARALNEVVPAALAAAVDEGPRITVRHQCGPAHLDAARAAYAAAGLAVEPEPFIADMAGAYGWADLVLCRAGAMTVAELAAAGVASVLVPFPHAVDDHQTLNARHLGEGGAAIILPEVHLSAGGLGRLLAELEAARDRLVSMARAARDRAIPDAAERVARLCAEACRG